MKRLLIISLILLSAPFALFSDDKALSPQERYIKKYSAIAVKEMRRTGVPASITLAQGILESGAGQSYLAVNGNNHFGIKCQKTWTGKVVHFDDDAPKECFRAYATAELSYKDHSDFLRANDRYKSLFELDPTDYKAWAKGLKNAGYATDPNYANKLIAIIQKYDLARYDGSKKSEIVLPEPPLQIEKQSQVRIEAKEHCSYSLSRPLYKRNGVLFVYAQQGETYSGIATGNNLFLKEILSFNEAPCDTTLAQGTVVYLARKKKYATPGIEKYVFASDETLHEICHRFAVKQKSIIKLNNLPADYVPQEGDVIKLRK